MSDDHPHLHKTGHSRLDLMLGIAALLMSGVSLYIAMHHGKTMEKLVTAATWPYVQLTTSDADTNGMSTRIRLSASNAGVGPARVVKAVMQYEGKPVTNSAELLRACCESTPAVPNTVVTSYIGSRVISAQEQIDYLSLIRNADNTALYAKFAEVRDRIDMAVCYCSVFDECWVARMGTPKPDPVKSCDALKGIAYGQ